MTGMDRKREISSGLFNIRMALKLLLYIILGCLSFNTLLNDKQPKMIYNRINR